MILAGDYIPKQKAVRLYLPPSTILANLEGPILCDHIPTPSPKVGPSLFSRAFDLGGRPFIFALANNHMMDYGVDGLEVTKTMLTKAGVPFCGAGANLEEARAPLIVTESGKKIGVISCCERQFGCAETARSGVAEKGLWLVDAVKELKQSVDFVIVSCHAAFEHSPFPSPRLRDFYHLLIHVGADVIHGHHAHVPQGWETYRDGLILYGLGNFVVDPCLWQAQNHRWAIVVQLDFTGDRIKWTPDFTDIGLDGSIITVKPSQGVEREQHMRYCEIANRVFADASLLQAYWQAACVELFDRLYGVALKSPRYAETKSLTLRNRARYLYDGLGEVLSSLLGRKLRSKRSLAHGLLLLNLFQCESHADVISTALGVLSGLEADRRTPDVKDAVEWMKIGQVE